MPAVASWIEPRERIVTVAGVPVLAGIYGASEIEVNAMLQELAGYAQLAANLELIQAQNAHDALLFQMQDASPYGAPIAGWWDDVKAAANRAAQQVAAAAQQVGAAAQQAVQQAQAAAQRAAAQARAAGQSVSQATQQAVAQVQRAVRHAKAQVLAVVAKANLSPAQRILAYMALPQPVGFVAAYRYAQRHETELLNDLPAPLRNQIRAFKDDLPGALDEGRGRAQSTAGVFGIAGYYSNPQTLAVIASKYPRIAGLMRVTGPFFDRWSDAWYHKLSPWGRRGLIALLIVLLIIVVIVTIYTVGAGTQASLSGAWYVIANAFASFAEAVGWPAFLGMLTGVLAWIRGGSAPEMPIVPTGGFPPPDNTSAQATAQALATSPDPDDPTGIQPDSGLAYSGGAAVALAIVAAV